MADLELPELPAEFLDEPTQGGIEQIAGNIQQAFPADQKKKPTASSSAGGSSVSASNKKKSLQDLFVKDKSKEAEIRKRLGISEENIAPKTSAAVSTGITQKPVAKAPTKNYKITKPGVETAMPSDRPTAETVEQTPFVMPKSVGPVDIQAPERETIAAESTGLVKQVPIKKYEHPVLSALSEDKIKEIEAHQKEVASGYAVMNFDEKLGQASFSGSNTGELLNMLTPRSLKSGNLGIMASLLSLSGSALKLFNETAVGSSFVEAINQYASGKVSPFGFALEGAGSLIGKGIFGLIGADEVNESLDYAKTNAFNAPPIANKLLELGQISQKLSSAQMAKAEINAGISDKNVGKDPVGLLTSPLEGDMVDGFKKLGLSVVQQIPNLLAISATGSVVLPAAALETGANLTEEYQQDKDISLADGISSTAKGVVAGLIENLFVTDIKALKAAGSAIGEVSWTGAKQQLKKVFEEKGEDGVRDLISRSYGEAFKKAFKGSAGESAEEILTEASNFIIDTIRTGKFDSAKFSQSVDKAGNAGLIGLATGGLLSGPVMLASVEPLTFDQKRKVVEFNKIAADPTVSEEVRKTAQIQANKIIKENADKTSAKYDLLMAMEPKKRQEALAKMTEIRKMEADLEKIQDPELQKSIQEKLDKANDELDLMNKMQLFKEMQKKAKEAAANAPTAMQGAETTQAPAAPLEVDHTQDQTAEPILEGKSKEQVKDIANFDKAIKSIDPKAKLILVNNEDAFAKELEKFHSAGTARDMAKGSAGIFVSNQDGTNPTVIVNTNLADNSTYGHEIFHLAVTSLAGKNPARFVEMQKKILGVLNKADSKKLTDFANAYDFTKLGEDTQAQRRAEEFLSELAGRLTSKDVRIQRTMLHDIANILHDFIKAFNIKALNDLADKYLGKYAETEQLAKFFEGFATSMQKGKKIDVSYLDSKPIQLNETQKARLEGLTPGTEAYHEASRLNAPAPTNLTFDPQLNNESIVDSGNDVTRQQLKPGNLTDTPEFKKYQKTVKGLGPEDVWLARALFSEEARGNKLYAYGTKDQIIQKMQDELFEIKAAATESNKYYLTTLYPDYIQKQIDKFTRENAVDLRTQWEMIRDSDYHRRGFIDQTAEIQKNDLLSNLNYLIGNDTYSVPFQYAMVKDLIGSRYEIADAETQEVVRKSIKPSQYNTTERSFNSLQPDIVALTYNEYGNKLANAGEAYQYASLNKPKVDLEYSDLSPYIFKESSTGEGTWLKFPQGNDKVVSDDLFKIAATSHKYPAKWCTGTEGTAALHLSEGDFYVFVDKKTGDARIAVRYSGSDNISEVRGLGEGQSVLAQDDAILKEIVDTFPDGDGYAKDALAQKMGKELISGLDTDAQYILSSERMENVENFTLYNEFKNAFINLADKYNIDNFLDILSTEDRSYNSKNYLLSNLKFAVKQFMPFLKDKLDIKPGELILDEKDFAYADLSKIKYILPNLNIYGTSDLMLSNKNQPDFYFPELLRATFITVDGGYNFNAPKLKKADTIKLEGNSKFVANNLEGSINFNKYGNKVKFEANKLASINLEGNIAIEKDDLFNIPSVKKIDSKTQWFNFDISFSGGDLFAENLTTIGNLSIVGQYYDSINDHIKIPNVESIRKINISNRKSKSEVLNFDKLENKGIQLKSLALLGNLKFNAPNLKSMPNGSIIGIVVGDGAKLSADKLQGSVKNLTVKSENAQSDQSEASLNSLDSVESYFEILNSSLSANKLQNAGKDFIVRSSNITLPNLKSAQNIEVRSNANLNLPLFNFTPTLDNYSPSVTIRSQSTLNAGNIEVLSKLDISGESNIIAPSLTAVLSDGIELNNSNIELPGLGIARKIYLKGSKLVAPKLGMILSKDEFGNNDISLKDSFNAGEPGSRPTQVESQLIAPNLGFIDPNEPITRQQITRLAPNGKPSNLNDKQYNTVRTPEFKDWFGDWENDPENASKFVDENGEPQVFYHGTNDEFTEFDLSKKRFKAHKRGIFFGGTLEMAKNYGEIQMPVFLNAKTIDYNKIDKNMTVTNLRIQENELIEKTTKEGVVLETTDKDNIPSGFKQYVVFDPNQVKSATGNVGTFSKESNDIRQQKANLWDGTRSARTKVESKEKEKKNLNSLLVPKNIYKQMFERNANIADALKEAGMAETFFMLYNKAGATPYATRKFAEAQLDIFGKLSKQERKNLDAVALLRRVIAIDTNFENRIADQKKNGLKEGEKALEMPKHPKFNDYGTGNEVDLNKDVAQKQLDKLKAHLGDEAFNKITERSSKLFGAFSDILKYKYENGLINKETYDLYKDYDYIPRKFLFDIDLEDIPVGAFNTRGVSITKEELAKIGRGSDEFAEVDTEKMLKMAMIAAQHRVFTNRAIQNMAKELDGLTAQGEKLSWLKPANITQLKKGVDALEKDGSPKIEGADPGFRNMFYKKDGKRYAVQLKESYAKEFYDEELYDTSNLWYKLATNALGAKLTQTMAVGANPFFVLRNIPVDILSQVYYNNIYSGHGLGVTAQMAKGFGGTFEIMAKMAKASSKIGDNSEILNLIKEYGEAGGLMTTQTDDSTYLGKVGDVLGYLGNVSEIASKLNAYRNVKEDLIKKFKKDNGTDPDADALKRIQLEAAYKARSAMDFNRGGLATKFGNGFLPFFNIQFQVAKISASYVKDNPVKFFNKISQSMGLVVGLTLLNMSRAGSDWENKDLKRDKETKLLFMNPFGKNSDGTLSYMALQVPAPVKFFWNIAQNIAETIHYQMNGITPPEPNPEKLAMFRNEFKKYLPNLKSSLLPPAFKAISEYLDNEDYFYGRKLSQDHLKNIFFSQEGAENENILTLYKTLFQGVEKNTGWGISPERFQKASESVITSPEYNALVSTLYTAAEWLGDKAYNGMFGKDIDPKLKSKYLAGDYSNAMKGFFKSGIGSMFKKTDPKKNETLSDFEKEQKLKDIIDYENKRINTDRIQITRDIKRIIKEAEKDGIDLKLEEQKFKNYIKGLETSDAKKYASSYVKMLIEKDQVFFRENIPTYLNILYTATSPEAQAIALKEAFGDAIYTDTQLRKDLKKVGFENAVARKVKQLQNKNAVKDTTTALPELPKEFQ